MNATPPQSAMDQQFDGGTRRDLLRRHALVALAVAAIGLAFYATVDHGNHIATDEWLTFYEALVNRSARFANRPLALAHLWLLVPLFKANLAAYDAVGVAVHIGIAFLIYLLVWQIRRDAPLFAVVCGALYLTFFIDDLYMLLTFFWTGAIFIPLLLTLSALNAYTAYMKSARWPFLAASLVLAYVIPMMYEGCTPLLLGAPVLIFLADRGFTRARVLGLAFWLVVTLAANRNYLLPLIGVGNAVYGTSLVEDFSIRRMLADSLWQFDLAFRELVLLDLNRTLPFRLPAFLTITVTLFALTVVRSSVQAARHAAGPEHALLRHAAWSVAGLAVTWLGFAAFLPTVYARSATHTHPLAMPGEAIFLAGVIWLASHAVRTANWRWIVRYVGIAWVILYGTYTAGKVQNALYRYPDTWENVAYFVRTLSHLAPSVEPGTLFVRIENLNLDRSPFLYPWSFDYAVRYFYEDTATGFTPDRPSPFVSGWEASEEGLTVFSGETGELYAWDQVIFITREDSGRLVILEDLPPEFNTGAFNTPYNPYASIQRSFVADRTRQAFPIIEPPHQVPYHDKLPRE